MGHGTFFKVLSILLIFTTRFRKTAIGGNPTNVRYLLGHGHSFLCLWLLVTTAAMVGPWEKDYTPGRSLKHFLSGSLWKKFVASDNVCSAARIQSYLSITGSVTLKSFVTFGGKIGFPKRENNPTC